MQLVDFLLKIKGARAAEAELAARIGRGGDVFEFQLALARLSFADGKHADAVDQLTRLIDEANDSLNGNAAKVELARMRASRNDVAGAEELVKEVLSGDPKNVEALTVRAAIHMVGGKATEAIDDLRIALNEAPESSRVLLLLASAYDRHGDVDLATDQFAKAVRIEQFRSDVALVYVQFLLRYGKIEQAERVLIAARAKSPSDRNVLSQLARVKLAKQDWLGAQEVSDALRKLGDREGEVAADQILGVALGGEQKYEQSITVLRSALSAADVENTSMVNLVRTYVQAGKQQAAEEFLDSVLKSNPDNAPANVLRGALSVTAKQPDSAEGFFNAAIAADPDGPSGYLALATLYISTGRLGDAEKAARDGLARQGQNGQLRLLLATALERSGQYEAAIGEYETMFERDPTSTVAANNLASLLSEYRQDPASHERAFEIAVRFRNSEIPQFVDTLGWIYFQRGEYGPALTLLKAAADHAPSAPAIQYHLGLAYEKLGQNALAIASLERSLGRAIGFSRQAEAQAALDRLLQSQAKP